MPPKFFRVHSLAALLEFHRENPNSIYAVTYKCRTYFCNLKFDDFLRPYFQGYLERHKKRIFYFEDSKVYYLERRNGI